MNADETCDSTGFAKKRMTDLFIAQSAQPAGVEPIDLNQLTPFQRALLVTDGTVTRFIEAYVLSPVEVVRLRQEERTLPADHVWLEVPKGMPLIAREVVLQTQRNGCERPTVYTYAVSFIVRQRLPETIRQGLEVQGKGLGRLLKGSGLETRRDLLWYGVERPKDLPEEIAYLEGHPFLSRAYRVVADNQPIMLINEKFPLHGGATPENAQEENR